MKTLELAISKAAELPEAAEAGIRELDAGLGEPLDIADLIAQAQREHAQR